MNDRPHNASTYTNHGCRCDECRKAWAAQVKRRQAERFALRTVVDGLLVAAHLPAEKHGVESTYGNWGCRCRDCTDVWSAASMERKARRATRSMAVAA